MTDVGQPGTSAGPAAQGEAVERKGVMERAIETMASSMGSGVTWLASSGVAFVIFGLLWVAFAVSLLWSQGRVDAAWDWLRSLPWIAQGLAWLLFLPVTAGVWIWETSWPLVLRLVLVAGLAGWSLLIFFPRAASAGR